jgi:hypothetical protein
MAEIIPDPIELRGRFGRRCRNCQQWIMWAWTRDGERMPLDAQPSEHGNVIAYRDPANRNRLLVTVYGATAAEPRRRLAQMRRAGWPTYTHHRISCPKAEEWARTRGRKGRDLKPPPAAIPTTRRAVDTAEQGTLL